MGESHACSVGHGLCVVRGKLGGGEHGECRGRVSCIVGKEKGRVCGRSMA